MARAPDPRVEQAEAMFRQGKKLIEIAAALDVPEGTVRSWKKRYGWDSSGNATLQKSRRNVAKKKNIERKAVAEAVEHVMQNHNLTDKQRLFCLLYVRCFNATKAYRKAYGCSYGTAMTNGAALLRNAQIREEISCLKQNRLNREMLDEHDIFQKYMDIAFADITEYVEFGRERVQVMGAFGPIQVVDPETGKKVPLTKEVNTVRFRESDTVDGTIIAEVKQGKDGASVKLNDRMKALEWLTAHMDLATEEQRVRIAAMKTRFGQDEAEEAEDDGFLEALEGSAKADWEGAASTQEMTEDET